MEKEVSTTVINTQAAKKREKSLDAVCGVLIIHMIVGHAFDWSHITDGVFIEWSNRFLFFFMAWFYYKSGMFHKEQSLSESVKKGYARYLKPYILYSFVGELLRFAHINRYGETNVLHYSLSLIRDILLEGAAYGNLPLWFLLSLFMVKAIVSFFDDYNVPKLLALLIAFVVSYLLEEGGWYASFIPGIVKSVSMGLLFYLSGCLLKRMQFRKSSLFISLLVSFCAIFVYPSHVDFRTGSVLQGVWIMYVISSLALIILVNNLFVIRFFQISFLVSIGRNSLSYYCFHWILFEIVFFICNYAWLFDTGHTNYMAFWTLIISCVAFLPLYSYLANIIKLRFNDR